MTLQRIVLASALVTGALGPLVAATPSANAATYTFQCTCLGGRNVPRAACSPNQVAFRLNTRTATVAGREMGGTFTYDAAYRGRGANASYLRYKGQQGRNALVEKQMRTGGYALRTGGKGGYMRLEITASDGYESLRYICRR